MRYDPKPKKQLSKKRDSFPCEIGAEAEETADHKKQKKNETVFRVRYDPKPRKQLTM